MRHVNTKQADTLQPGAVALRHLLADALLHGLRLGAQLPPESLQTLQASARDPFPLRTTAQGGVEIVASCLLRRAASRLPYYAAEGAASRAHVRDALHMAALEGVERSALVDQGSGGDWTEIDPEWLAATTRDHLRRLLSALEAEGIAVPGAAEILTREATTRPSILVGPPGPDQEYRTDWFRDPDGGRLQLAVRWRNGSLGIARREYGDTRFTPVTSIRIAYVEPLAALLAAAAGAAAG